MSDYIDAILHIADLPALVDMVAAASPDAVQDGAIVGIARTPATMLGKAALVYVRMTPTEAAQWRGTPHVTIIAESPYAGEATPDAVYTVMAADPVAMAMYDAVYPRSPVIWIDEEGQRHEITPPFRFGAIG